MSARLAVHSHSSVFAEYLRNLEPFQTNGRLFGTIVYLGPGLLDDENRSDCESADLRHSLSYVVYSYGTPIAWCVDGQWVVPDVKYSPTTSQHQNTIKAALAEL